MQKYNLDWAKAAGIRALKTMAQTALSMLSIGALISDISWGNVLSVAVVAGVYSILTSLTGLPETGMDGSLLIDTSDPDKDIYRLSIDTDLSKLPTKASVVLKVDSNADLSQKNPVL